MTRNRTPALALLVASPLLALTPLAAWAGRDRHDATTSVHTRPAYRQQLAVYRTPVQTGLASWYGGSRWQGNLTSSGERFDDNRLTAAHASLPLGSLVRVTLVDTTQSVVVTITDRPGTSRRIIDLSRGAAAHLGMLDRGLAKVVLQPL